MDCISKNSMNIESVEAVDRERQESGYTKSSRCSSRIQKLRNLKAANLKARSWLIEVFRERKSIFQVHYPSCYDFKA